MASRHGNLASHFLKTMCFNCPGAHLDADHQRGSLLWTETASHRRHLGGSQSLRPGVRTLRRTDRENVLRAHEHPNWITLQCERISEHFFFAYSLLIWVYFRVTGEPLWWLATPSSASFPTDWAVCGPECRRWPPTWPTSTAGSRARRECSGPGGTSTRWESTKIVLIYVNEWNCKVTTVMTQIKSLYFYSTDITQCFISSILVTINKVFKLHWKKII
jgi:hypothetical protein